MTVVERHDNDGYARTNSDSGALTVDGLSTSSGHGGGGGNSSARLVSLLAMATVFSIASFSALLSRLSASSSYAVIDIADPSFPDLAPQQQKASEVAERLIFNRLPTLSAANTTRQKLPRLQRQYSLPLPRGKTATARLNVEPSKRPSIPLNASENGMHLCTCLDGDDARNLDLPERPKRLRWLHIPKTGTSFISTLWAYATTTGERYIDLSISSHVCTLGANTSYSMYDFALMRRYPWEIYGAPIMIPPSSGGTISQDTPLGLVGGTQHVPLTPDLKDENFRRSWRFSKIKGVLRRWGSEIHDHGFTVVSFFRQPEERIMSAYYDGRHSSGFKPEVYKDLVRASVQRVSRHTCKYGKDTYFNPLECFARFPGIAGCMSRMLTGEMCADGSMREAGLENLPDAIGVILNHLDFVGLTEEWNESICQFHRLFTSNVDNLSGKRWWNPPLQGEFTNVHKSTKRKDFGIEHLHGFKDASDTVVYEAAKLKFQQMVGGQRCYKYLTWDEIKAQRLDKDADLPFLKTDDQGNVCKPKSCSDLGKQCGEWDDGCGKIIICGMCASGRTGLPSTWRVKCLEGKCIDYCPPWDEKGYWFLSGNLPTAINEVVQAMNITGQRHLSPADAVMICERACDIKTAGTMRRHGFGAFFDTNLCRCGEPSTTFARDLTLRDFSLAHDLGTSCKFTKARMEGFLMENDTQPACCPHLGQKMDLPVGWKRLYSIGSKNLEGEYFDHVRIECGAFEECKLVAQMKQAEMAVFDMLNSMCYLARNVFDLGTGFAVTKDNQNRFMLDLR